MKSLHCTAMKKLQNTIGKLAFLVVQKLKWSLKLIVVKIGSTKLALDAEICRKIYVSELTKTNEASMEM